jgi:hypothetical protein
MKQETPRGSAIANVIKSDGVVEIGKEALEMGIDAALESGILKDIPIVSTIVGVFNVGGTIRDQLLASKVICFLAKLSELSKEERDAMVDKLNEDRKFAGRVGDALVEILDRMESERKPGIAAKCFAAYARGHIDYLQLRRLLVAIERLPSFDIDELREFAESTIEEQGATDQHFLISLVNAGLAQNNGGWDGGVTVPTRLCALFLQLDLDR